jgi:hypothetical protein
LSNTSGITAFVVERAMSTLTKLQQVRIADHPSIDDGSLAAISKYTQNLTSLDVSGSRVNRDPFAQLLQLRVR